MRQSYTLPSIARDPAGETARLVKLRLRDRDDGRVASTTRSLADQIKVAYGHAPKARPPRSPVSLPALVSPRNEGGDEASFAPTDLTLTYLGVLERCEDYSRRELIKQDERSHGSFQQWIDDLNSFNEAFVVCAGEVNEDEQSRRKKLLSDERSSFKELRRKKAQSEISCRKRERFVIPCSVMEVGTTTSIDPRCCDNMLVELLWRGPIELSVALIFEGDPYAVADKRTPLKGRHESLAARIVGQSEEGSGSVVGGAFQRFCLSLAGLSRHIERVSICVTSSSLLSSLNEGWIVLHSLDSQFNIEGRMAQHAAAIPSAACHSTTMCILRRTGPSWRVLALCGAPCETKHASQLGFSRTAAFAEKEWLFMEESERLLVVQSEAEVRQAILQCTV